MPRKPPPEHSRFKPGQSGNPGGMPKQLLTQDKVSSVLGKFCMMTREELAKIVENPKSPMLDVMVASVMARAAKDGDYSRLEFLLARSVGKVRDISEVHQHTYDGELDQEPRENVLELLRSLRGPKTGT